MSETTDSSTEAQRAANQRMWEERAKLHPDSEMYRRYFDKLRAGGDCLLPIEKTQLGDLSGPRRTS